MWRPSSFVSFGFGVSSKKFEARRQPGGSCAPPAFSLLPPARAPVRRGSQSPVRLRRRGLGSVNPGALQKIFSLQPVWHHGCMSRHVNSSAVSYKACQCCVRLRNKCLPWSLTVPAAVGVSAEVLGHKERAVERVGVALVGASPRGRRPARRRLPWPRRCPAQRRSA